MGTSRNSAGGDGRGAELATGFASLPGVEIAYVCDVDERNVTKAIESVMKKSSHAAPPRSVADFRRILDDKEVDALVIATPDHWHAPAAILACSAGKHVYVEKPCCHNPHEGELLVAAARNHQRLVQHGTQRRSWPGIVEAISRLHAGELGRVLFAKAYYFNKRPSIGRGTPAEPPAWLDYALWQGPAPEQPYRDNILHYHWHWFWHWGTGELGNNGVHSLDVCRWGLGAQYAESVTSTGGKYAHPDDDQETPDTNVVSFDFGDTMATWEQRSWSARTPSDPAAEVTFHGEKGTLTISGGSYAIHDPAGKEVAKGSGSAGNDAHLQNFIDAIRGEAKLNAEIEEGWKSTLLCHVGNIAWRNGRAMHLDPQTHRIANDSAAMKLWRREYREGWEPKV
jgi:predicted dehydrogenase